MDVDAYLARIGATRDDGIAALHGAHVRTVPFENYDIHRGVPISLEPGDLFDKIVRRGRGGFCYELNGLFAELLRALGHDVTLVSAFELDGGPDFDHLRLIVDGAWLADVGNGARQLEPVPLRPGIHGRTQVHHDGELWWTSTLQADDTWQPGWAWTSTAREPTDFLPRCRYQEHDPQSHFVQRRLASLAVEHGRIALLNGVFSETGCPDREVDADAERALLASRFGIVVNGWDAL